MNFKKFEGFFKYAAISTIGLGLFFLFLFLLVLPNTINTISCTIDQTLIETKYAAYKTYCGCNLVNGKTDYCTALMAKNQTGRCIETDCCFQSDNDECEIQGATICNLDYCWKTLAKVSMSYSGGNRLFIYTCGEDWLYCDTKTTVDECTFGLNNSYAVGKRTCYYRKADDKVDFYTFDTNFAFFIGILLIILTGIFTLSLLVFC